ncbi:MAG: D-aminoacyl-tRNA deacylase [Candidatus Aureabacteria bacterium]|nr:D-aminoacyl-tRNA deacylase [Candidatus Auribacterota bacterium]
MRAVVQRVKKAAVEIGGETVAATGLGFLVLLGVGKDDAEKDASFLAEKIANLRIFEDSEGKMNLSLKDTGGAALVVSQFTLYGDCRKGRRPSFTDAAPPEKGEALYKIFIDNLRAQGIAVETGQFGAKMLVKLENDGPVTLIVES